MMRMPMISICEVTDCSYNSDEKCHALAITVGDSLCAMCDTYDSSKSKGGDLSVSGGVGACKSDNCKYNKSLECIANSITVGMHADHADCMTFASR